MFNLKDYISDINGIASHYKIEALDALEFFVVNLTTMKEYYKGASNLNYHVLGQQWNKLLSDQKFNQKAEVSELLQKANRRNRNLEV